MRNWPLVARLESRLRLILPWTQRGEINRLIGLVAEEHDVTLPQAFALLYAAADDRERQFLEPYRPTTTGD